MEKKKAQGVMRSEGELLRRLPFTPRHSLWILLSLSFACATIGSQGEGDKDLPTSGAGPFRKLGPGEMLGVAPFVLDDKKARYREPAALASGRGDAGVFLYVVAREGGGDAGPAHDVLARTRADDARSFFGGPTDVAHAPARVLAADQPWEGADLSGPWAVKDGDQIVLYYAAAGGIGVARSSDGLAFQKRPMPVFVQSPDVPWETTPPHAPSVARLPDGRWRMLYAAGAAIGEASSADGESWTRLDADPSTPVIDPLLAPAPPVDPSTLAPGEKPPFDTAEVTDPCVAPRVTAAGRLQFRVLYTGYADPPATAGRNGTIGFAARYGDTGALSRQPQAVYSVSRHEAAPALFEWSGGAMLYVQQDDATDPTMAAPGIAAAFAPPTITLDMPAAYADSP